MNDDIPESAQFFEDRTAFLEKIKEEIDAVMDAPTTLRADDITVKDIMQMYDVSDKTALRMIKKLAKQLKGYELTRAYTGRAAPSVFVLRKIE